MPHRLSKRKLYPHQQDMLSYCRREEHPALFVEMRLGKCVVAIRRCQTYTPRNPGLGLRVLIVAPFSALDGWERELRLEGEKGVVYLTGEKGARFKALWGASWTAGNQWCLFNKEGHLSLPEVMDVWWDAVILDESHFIKNPQAQVTEFFLNRFGDVPHRWLLTGTPNPQGDLDLWTQLAFLDGKAFGHASYWDFRASRFSCPVWSHDWKPNVGTRTLVKRTLAERAFVLKKADVGLEIPTVYERRLLELPGEVQDAYRTAEEEFLLEWKGKEVKDTKHAVVRLQWLRQLCSGYLDGEFIWRGKYTELVTLLQGELAHEPVVVWFNYNNQLRQAAQMLEVHGMDPAIVYGDINKASRREEFSRFREGKTRILLAQQAVAQTGLDLSIADTCIYFNPPLGTLARSQTEARIERLGKRGPLLVVDLCVKDSVDTDILDALQDKTEDQTRMLRRVLTLIRRRNRNVTHS